MINHHGPFRALMVRHRIYNAREKYTRCGAVFPGTLLNIRHLERRLPVSGLACHPERSEGSGSPDGETFASLRACPERSEGTTGIISKCLPEHFSLRRGVLPRVPGTL